MKILVLGTAIVLVAVTAAAAVEAVESEFTKYAASMAKICEFGVTPEMEANYQFVIRAMEDAKYGYGRSSNFWGPSAPDDLYHRCFQAPGGGGGGGDD